MPETFFITTPIYYINATPHIGHAYTQIAADARARFERMRGKDVYFLTGTDENAVKIARVAEAQSRDIQEFCNELASAFRDVWDGLNISYDDYIRTTQPRHRVVVQRVFEKLWQDKHIRLDKYSGWYSVPDETFFRDEETIERDGEHFIAKPTQDQTKAPLEWVEETSHFFDLSKFQDFLLEYYDAHPETLRPEARRNETLSYIRQGLRDTSISRELDWGIPVPQSVPEHENHVIYVWFPDALLNYASAPGYLSDDPERRAHFERFWPPDLQLMSKDIFTRFHSTLWPALLKALDLEPPRELFAHGFWTVEGRKMSKRDPATIVEPIEFAKQIAELANCEFETAVDALRYYCLREVTFGADGDFSRLGCVARYNSDLANGLGNLVNRALSMLQQYFDGEVPAAQGELGLISALRETLPRVETAYATLDFSGALSAIWEIVGQANKLIEDEKPWVKMKAGEKESVALLLRELLATCQWCAAALFPALPHSSRRLAQLLNLGELSWDEATDTKELFSPGHRCVPPAPLFPRIPKPETITEEHFLKIMETPNNEPTPSVPPIEAAPIEEIKPERTMIEYDDFAKIEFRTGKVLEAERVPKADKLLRLQVDIGSETRQILAGVAEQFEPENLVGKTIVVVANLKPRKLRGFESQGMLLAASQDDGPPLALVSFDGDVPPGCVVR